MNGDEKTDRHQMDVIYPDMNYIFFKGVPKLIQIADDMHRMTGYIMDLRNMTIGFVCFSFMEALIFLFLRQIQKRSSTDMHERMIMANHLEDQRKSMQSLGGTCRKYSEPCHGPSRKTSAFKLFHIVPPKKTKSILPTAKANGCPDAKFANRNQQSNQQIFF